MKLVFRISTRIRAAAPTPRGFLPIPGLEHLGLIYEQKIVSSPEEFNTILATISEKRFANRGCEFQAYALTAQEEAIAEKGIQILTERRVAEAARQAAEAAALEAASAETAPEESQPETPETSEVESSQGTEPEAQEAEESAPEAETEAETVDVESDPEPNSEPTDPANPDPAPDKFRLDGKAIFMGEDRVAGLFGEDSQLRVLAQFIDLKPEIKSWLESLSPL